MFADICMALMDGEFYRNKHYYTKEGEHAAFTRAMKNVIIANGLEYKISCNTSKVNFLSQF